jgi:hypothetical protein
MCIGLRVIYPLFLHDFNSLLFSENSQTSNLIKISLVVVELFHTDRRTSGRIDRRDEINFRNFSKAPENETEFWRPNINGNFLICSSSDILK